MALGKAICGMDMHVNYIVVHPMTLSTSTFLFIFVIVCMYQVQTLYPTKYHEVPPDIIGKASPYFKTVTIIIDLVSSFCYCYSCIVEQWVCLASTHAQSLVCPFRDETHNDPRANCILMRTFVPLFSSLSKF